MGITSHYKSIGKVSYSSLESITQSSKPFRGFKNRYPTHGDGWRTGSHAQKCFYVEELDGEKVFTICYGQQHSRVDVTKEYYELAMKINPKQTNVRAWKKHEYVNGTYIEKDEMEYFYYKFDHQRLGVIRPDNTFEFTCDHLYQGERMYLENYLFVTSDVYVGRDCRKGGAVLTWYNRGTVRNQLPLYKGLRISLDTFEPYKDNHIVFYKNVIDRKLAKESMSGYSEMLSVSKAMFSSMGESSFTDVLRDILKEHGLNFDDTLVDKVEPNDLWKQADKLREDGNEFDSAILYGYLLNVGNVHYHLRWRKSNTISPTKFVNLDRTLSNHIYKRDKPFKRKAMELGKPIGSSTWGYSLFQNGVACEQY